MSLSKENKVIIDGQTYYGGLNQPNLKFIKVNVDCWEKIFDFLSLHDILAMSQTCQRMRQIDGHYFRENFHGTICYLSGLLDLLSISIENNKIEHNDFLRFIDTVNVYNKLEYLRTVSSVCLLSSLTTLRLWNIEINEHELHGFENIQTNIEAIELNFGSIVDNSVSKFLASCPKLKLLRLYAIDYKSTEVETGLFQRSYPMLESFQFHYSGPEEMAQLIPFLERNPNINCLHIEARDLQEVPLNVSSAQVEYLNIDMRGKINADELLNRLRTLHANGFFNKLRLSVDDSLIGFNSEVFFREMIAFGALEVLDAYNVYTPAINHLTQLKELHLIHYMWLNDDIIDLEEMAVNFINLERLGIGGTVEQLSSFIRHSKKLKFVIFFDKNDGCNALNVFKLNDIRKMSGMKRKIQIGVVEDQYLATKWNENSLNCDLIEITRGETVRKHFYYKNI